MGPAGPVLHIVTRPNAKHCNQAGTPSLLMAMAKPLVTPCPLIRVLTIIPGLERKMQFYLYLAEACAAPKFNRPHKASVDTLTGLPYKIEWGPQTGHTAAYPVTHKKYTLNAENFDCSQDTAYIRQNILNCNSSNVKIAFYVFETTQESYVQIDGIADGLWSSVYAFDVRTADSTRLLTEAPLQTCLNKKGAIEFCKLQPGIYTLVYYAPVNYNCSAVTPTIYIDQVGTSRFDHAANAYDFGKLVPDSTWYSGKPGDVNPLNSGRTPSNDFFYCTTGARQNDPDFANCRSLYNPNIYNAGTNIVLHPDNNTAPDHIQLTAEIYGTHLILTNRDGFGLG